MANHDGRPPTFQVELAGILLWTASAVAHHCGRTTRSSVSTWSKRRATSGFPHPLCTVQLGAERRKLYDPDEITAWWETYTPARGKGTPPQPIRHGSTTGYRRGCRQLCCSAAQAAYDAARARPPGTPGTKVTTRLLAVPDGRPTSTR